MDSNFDPICVRSASEGTTTSSNSGRVAVKIEIIVSVFPVPVGITTVAGSVGAVVQ